MEATKDLKNLLEIDPNNSIAQQEFDEVKQLWAKKLREIQLQKETTKVTPPGMHKTKSKVGGTSRKKSSGQRKSSMKEMKEAMRNNPMAELQRTKYELEKLLKQTSKLQEAAKFESPLKKPVNPSQTRRSELEKLIKESKTKTKTNSETKASDGKEAKAGAPRASGSRGAGTRGGKARVRASSSDQSQTPATPTETRAGEETMPDVFVTEKNGSEGHLTASKTTYYKGQKARDMEDSLLAVNEVTPRASPLSSEPADENKRKKVVIEEGSESDEEEEEEEVKSETATRQDESTANSSSARQLPTVVSQDLREKPPVAVASPTATTTKAKERLVSYVQVVSPASETNVQVCALIRIVLHVHWCTYIVRA